MNWEPILWVGQVCLLIFLVALAILLWYLYKKFIDRPPERSGSDWSKRIWRGVNGGCQFNGPTGFLTLITDEDSPLCVGEFKLLGVINEFNNIVTFLVQEKGWFPRREVILAPRKWVRDIHSQDIKIVANGLKIWGDFLKVTPTKEWASEADYWDKQYVEWFDSCVLDQLSSAVIAKTNEETLAVLELSPQKSSLLDRVLDNGERILGIGKEGKSDE